MRLHRFVRHLHTTLDALLTPDGAAAAMVRTTEELLATSGLAPSGRASTDATANLPATHHLASAINAARQVPELATLADALGALVPELSWARRAAMPGAGPEFADGHANAVIVGEGGLAAHLRVTIGLTVMAPGVLYADHSHPPSEVYLVLSPGQWRQRDGSWHEPGLGGTVYNPPAIVHAMRSGNLPLLAIWTLLADSEG